MVHIQTKTLRGGERALLRLGPTFWFMVSWTSKNTSATHLARACSPKLLNLTISMLEGKTVVVLVSLVVGGLTTVVPGKL